VFYFFKKNLPFLFLFWIHFEVIGQGGLAGSWKGTLTIGGLESTQTKSLELYLQIQGKKITGRSYLELNPGKIVVMSIEGMIFDDRSGLFEEKDFFPSDIPGISPPFFRKYQFVYKRSIWESTIEGFWQEILEDPLDTKRSLGKIKLKKVQDLPNKA
jgi:hypothetical protein